MTSFRLGDDTYTDLYFWDEVVADGRISILSLHGWREQLQPPALTLERALANALVSCLADILEHRSGPKDCPLFFNPDRLITTIAGVVRFDDRCRRLIRRSSGERLKALDAVLAAFV